MATVTTCRPLPLGRLLMTRGIAAAAAASPRFALGVQAAISRHERGDWGDVCPEDHRANNWSLAHGERILSAYIVEGERIWILTERDRSATTVLFPSEY